MYDFVFTSFSKNWEYFVSISPNFFCQAKSCWRTVFAKKIAVQFHQPSAPPLEKICQIIMLDLWAKICLPNLCAVPQTCALFSKCRATKKLLIWRKSIVQMKAILVQSKILLKREDGRIDADSAAFSAHIFCISRPKPHTHIQEQKVCFINAYARLWVCVCFCERSRERVCVFCVWVFEWERGWVCVSICVNIGVKERVWEAELFVKIFVAVFYGSPSFNSSERECASLFCLLFSSIRVHTTRVSG